MWDLREMEKLFGPRFITRTDDLSTADVFADNIVALYFSAHWCPPCKQFTPKFSEVYNKINAERQRLQVIFISFDRTEDDMLGYLDEVKFSALPYEDKPRREFLGFKYQSSGIPTLVVLNPDASVASMNGRAEVLALRENVIDYWEKLIRKEPVSQQLATFPRSIRRFKIMK